MREKRSGTRQEQAERRNVQVEAWQEPTGDWAGFDVHDFQRGVIAEFRANGGKLGGMFEGWNLTVLTTVGRGRERPAARKHPGISRVRWTTPDLAQQMRAHCLDFCGALTEPHGGEDMALFPALANQFPALAPALAQLGDEHQTVARAQQAIRELVDGFVPGESDPGRLREELERLAHRLESHFTYEEETIVTALNATAPAPYAG